MTLACLRVNLTFAELAGGPRIPVAACQHTIGEGIRVLSGRGRRISLTGIANLAVTMGWDYLIVDGTPVPAQTWGRNGAGQRALSCGTHKRHGLTIQAVCSPGGDPLWHGGPQPGASTAITAARQGWIARIPLPVIAIFPGLGYPGWNQEVITGRKKPKGMPLTPAQRAANRLRAPLQCAGERGSAPLEQCVILSAGPRRGPKRCTGIVKAVLAPHNREHDQFAVLRAA